MASKVSKQEKEEIIALYALYGSYNKVAKEMKRTDKTIKKVIEQNPNKSEQIRKKQITLIKKSDVIVEQQMKLVDDIFTQGLKAMRDIIKGTEKSTPQDKISAFRAVTQFKYQVKNLELKERDVIVKEALADKIIRNDNELETNEVTIIDDMPKGDSSG